jgi:hypothetical protein
MTMARFPQYSLCNAMLIAMQRPHASRVAGFQTWRRLGRHVKKGEQGISILAPIAIQRETDDDEEEEEVIAFKTAFVFDVEQTEGKPLSQSPTAVSNLNYCVEKLKETSRELGIDTGDEMVKSMGFSTLVLEVAHEMLNRTVEEERSAAKETEAEAVLFVVSTAIGIITNRSTSDYTQLYQGDKKLLMESLYRIHAVATDILRGIGAIEAKKKPSTEERPMAVRAAA